MQDIIQETMPRSGIQKTIVSPELILILSMQKTMIAKVINGLKPISGL